MCYKKINCNENSIQKRKGLRSESCLVAQNVCADFGIYKYKGFLFICFLHLNICFIVECKIL